MLSRLFLFLPTTCTPAYFVLPLSQSSAYGHVSLLIVLQISNMELIHHAEGAEQV
uniref:Uncharacterized protein n=1 Tax=Anguilla anguilla TaxID=7936 RepID=A0A0E9QCB4_ANGAN